jgi:small conductance mechanosensitive channel
MRWLAQAQDTDVDLDPVAQVVEAVETAIATFLSVLPGLLLGALILTLFVVVGRFLRRRLEPRLAEARTPSFGRVFATLIYAALWVAGLLVALPIAFPTLNAATVLGGLGLLGVAAGFAFQDILSNLLAGVLLIFRQPFTGGDVIEVNGLRGTVEGITIRETRLKTFDGRLLIIPNHDVYTNAIEVQTAYDAVRSSAVVGVAYGSDLAAAREIALRTVKDIDGVAAEPAPQAFYTELGASAVDLDVRYWTDPQQASVRATQDRVVEAIHDAFEAEGIDIPFDIVTLDADDSFAEAMRRF